MAGAPDIQQLRLRQQLRQRLPGLRFGYAIILSGDNKHRHFDASRKGAQIAVLLVPTTQPEEIEQYGIRVAEAWKLGRKGVDDGAILLVEDEEAVRAFASRALASRGYTVLEADSGLDALRVVEEAGGKIDLIVSDVIMPEMDGPTMLTELRKRGLTAKIIFVSGYADDAFAKNLPEGQEFVFLPKPFSLKQLIETVKGAMS